MTFMEPRIVSNKGVLSFVKEVQRFATRTFIGVANEIKNNLLPKATKQLSVSEERKIMQLTRDRCKSVSDLSHHNPRYTTKSDISFIHEGYWASYLDITLFNHAIVYLFGKYAIKSYATLTFGTKMQDQRCIHPKAQV